MTEYFGLLALVGVGLVAALLLYLLAGRLRRIDGAEEAPVREQAAEFEGDERDQTNRSTSRYFLLAVVGLALHAGAFYFYLWGASVRSAGLPGLLVMVMLGFCLITGVFYAWARGTVSYGTGNTSANEASTLSE